MYMLLWCGLAPRQTARHTSKPIEGNPSSSVTSATAATAATAATSATDKGVADDANVIHSFCSDLRSLRYGDSVDTLFASITSTSSSDTAEEASGVEDVSVTSNTPIKPALLTTLMRSFMRVAVGGTSVLKWGTTSGIEKKEVEEAVSAFNPARSASSSTSATYRGAVGQTTVSPATGTVADSDHHQLHHQHGHHHPHHHPHYIDGKATQYFLDFSYLTGRWWEDPAATTVKTRGTSSSTDTDANIDNNMSIDTDSTDSNSKLVADTAPPVVISAVVIEDREDSQEQEQQERRGNGRKQQIDYAAAHPSSDLVTEWMVKSLLYVSLSLIFAVLFTYLLMELTKPPHVEDASRLTIPYDEITNATQVEVEVEVESRDTGAVASKVGSLQQDIVLHDSLRITIFIAYKHFC
jgi:hypothetical protein